MKTRITIVIAAVIVLWCSQSNGQPVSGSVDTLKSSSFAQRKGEIELLKKQRSQSIERMIIILNGNFSPDIKESAAIALGNCRASEAVNVLTKNIMLDVRPRIMGFLSEDELNPVSTSLQKIGNPSVPAIIEFLEENGSVSIVGKTEEERTNTLIRGLLIRTLCRIDGDKDIVRLRLQKALAAQHDPQGKARLQSALDALTKM